MKNNISKSFLQQSDKSNIFLENKKNIIIFPIMILGHGIDIVDISRIAKTYEKFGDKFLKKFLSTTELEKLPDAKTKIVPFLAKHWAVKEATSKAVGCGLINGSPLHFKDIILDHEWTGMPKIQPTENLLIISCQMYGLEYIDNDKLTFHTSTSGDAGVVVASVILEIN